MFSIESVYINSLSNWDNIYILILFKNKKVCVLNFFFLNVVIYIWFGKYFFLIIIYWKNRIIVFKDLYNIYFLFYFWYV